jgi:hypothetical protein
MTSANVTLLQRLTGAERRDVMDTGMAVPGDAFPLALTIGGHSDVLYFSS